MGMFSWITSDTNESIPVTDNESLKITVYMRDNKGNVWEL